MNSITAKAQSVVRASPLAVFNAFIDAETMSKFWFTRRDERLHEGMTVSWFIGQAEDAYAIDHLNLALDDEEGATLQQLQGHSIAYRIAMGPPAGRKVLTACAARCKQFQPGKRMTMAPASLARLEDSRCMGAAFRPGWR